MKNIEIDNKIDMDETVITKMAVPDNNVSSKKSIGKKVSGKIIKIYLIINNRFNRRII